MLSEDQISSNHYYVKHNQALGIILILISYSNSVILLLDIIGLYGNYLRSTDSSQDLYSFLYYYNHIGGVHYNKFYLMIAFLLVIIFSFTAGINFIQETKKKLLLNNISFFWVLVGSFIVVNVLPFLATLLFNETNYIINLTDNMTFLVMFFILTFVYYNVFANPKSQKSSFLLTAGIFIILFSISMELLGYLAITFAPKA